MTTSEFKQTFFQYIEASSDIAITSHISPDDDSIGSVLLMRSVLTARYPQKRVRIVYTGNSVDRYKVFNGFETIEWVEDIAHHLEGVDTLVMLDASQYKRFSLFPDTLKDIRTTIAIDHHASVPDEFTLLFKDETFSSNAELTYRTLVEGGEYTKEQAEYILLGILGDTGNFAYVKPQQSEVFMLARDLIKKIETPIDAFRSRYGGIPLRIIPLLQELVKNTSYETVPHWPPLQYTHIDREVFQNDDYTDEDMSAASHIYMGQYLPRVQGYSWGFVVTPRADGGCRMSGRSLPSSVNVRDLHERLGIGSGHDRASGGYFTEADPKKCIKTVLEWIKKNEPLVG